MTEVLVKLPENAQSFVEQQVSGLESGGGEEATPEWWDKKIEQWTSKHRGAQRTSSL